MIKNSKHSLTFLYQQLPSLNDIEIIENRNKNIIAVTNNFCKSVSIISSVAPWFAVVRNAMTQFAHHAEIGLTSKLKVFQRLSEYYSDNLMVPLF